MIPYLFCQFTVSDYRSGSRLRNDDYHYLALVAGMDVCGPFRMYIFRTKSDDSINVPSNLLDAHR